MNKLKPSSKLLILSIISCAIIVVGMALGTVFHFYANGFFYYGGEYSSYKSVTVSYRITEVSGAEGELDLAAICEDAFKSEGVSGYDTKGFFNDTQQKADGEVTYRFPLATDSAALNRAVEKINQKISEITESAFGEANPATKAQMHEEYAVLGGAHAISRAAIALACIIAIHLIYTMIRYRFSAAFAAIVVDLHNLALFAALLAICRVPVTSAVTVFGVIIVLVTVIGVTYMFDRIKRNLKDSANEKLTISEITDMSAAQTLKANIALPAFLAIVAVLFFATMALSAMSVIPALAPALLALVAFAVTIYGNVLFAPAIYCLFKNTGNKIILKPSQKKGN